VSGDPTLGGLLGPLPKMPAGQSRATSTSEVGGAVMTPAAAARLAARTLTAIDQACDGRVGEPLPAADRDRVASDLLGLREVWAYWRTNGLDGDPTGHSHGRRYADGLRRSAALYGVTS
jgi:hypothetical protein